METVEKTDNQQREAVAPNWDALNYSAQFGDASVVEEQKAAAQEVETKESVEGKAEEVNETPKEKVETTETDTKSETTEAKSEETKETAKEEVKTDEPAPIEFLPEDVGLKPEHEDGSWKKLGQELFGEELTEDSFDAFKPVLDTKLKAEFERGRATTIEAELATLKPEVATALKLIEAGVPQEQALNPTGHLDAALAMDDASLLRAEYEARGWDAEKIDIHMEIVSEDPRRLMHEAELLRDDIKVAKTNIETARQNILQQYEQNKGKVALQQAEEQRSQVLDSLKSVKEYLGGKLPDATREAVIQKFNQGGYDTLFNDPAARARFILQETFGEKAIKLKMEQEYQRGKLEKVKELSNVPPVGSKVAKTVEGKVNQINQWDALERSEFGEKK